MTAVLGVLNKHAVAIAADSAVTRVRPNGQKISNTANKIFKLSKSYPVGVALYNSSEYMGTPWDIVISTYRKKAQNTHFDYLNGYVRDFIDYVRDEFNPTPDDEKEMLAELMINIWPLIEKECMPKVEEQPVSVSDFVAGLLDKIRELTTSLAKVPLHKEYTNYNIETFLQNHSPLFEDFYSEFILKHRTLIASTLDKDEVLGLYSQLIFTILVTQNNIMPFTGLVFAGYGEKQYFPSLLSIQVYPTIQGKMRYVVTNERHISKDDEAAIYPYAQHDVIDTILSGVDPQLESEFVNNGMSMVNQIQNEISDVVSKENPDLAEQIRNLDTDAIRTNLQALNDSVKKRNYIDPLLVTVGAFSKEELANMAERMIDLTSLKRKMTFDEESVGGPVDVVVISKTEGFIWIRRKQYFDKELNIDYPINKIHDDTKSI